MKRIIILLSFLTLVSCKKELADVKPGTDISEVKKDFGQPKKTAYLFGAEILSYDTHFIIFSENKVTRVYTKEEFTKYLDDLEGGFKSMEDTNTKLNEWSKETDAVIKQAEKTMNEN